jgi:hypothetical protein
MMQGLLLNAAAQRVSKSIWTKGMSSTQTSARAWSIVASRSETSRQSTRPVSMTRGTTLAAIKIAINREAIGSKPVQP